MSTNQIDTPVRRMSALLMCAVGAAGTVAASQCAAGPAVGSTLSNAGVKATAAYARLPLRFEENRGQTHARARFVARANRFNVFLSPTEALFDLQGDQPGSRSVMRMELVGARASAPLSGVGSVIGRSSYLKGRDRSKWLRNVPGYGKVRYAGVYPGVDAVFYGKQQELEYDFLVAAGASPSAIRLGFRSGASKPLPLRIESDGSLVTTTSTGKVRQHPPVAYQEIGGERVLVAAKYDLKSDGQVGFRLGRYDRSRELVIDPVITYATYLGGQRDDEAFGVASDASGCAYITGITNSVDFPLAGSPYQPALQADHDAFVTKMDPGNCSLIYSTYLGGGLDSLGPGLDRATAIAVGADGSAYVTGYTDSSDFPTTLGAFQTTNAGGGDAFVAKLTPAGDDLTFSSCLGGVGSSTLSKVRGAVTTGKDEGKGIAIDAEGTVSVVGATSCDDFPTTPGSFQPDYGGGNTDGFIVKFTADGSALVYGSFLGGGPSNKSEGNDFVNGVALDVQGNAYLTGGTDAHSFPKSRPFQKSIEKLDAFATKVNPTGTQLVYSTLIGGAKDDIGTGIALDSLNRAVIVGTTASTSFPSLPRPFEPFGGGDTDAFIARVNAEATAVGYFGFIGGAERDFATGVAVDERNRAWIVGGINWPNARATSARGTSAQTRGDGFVKQLNAGGTDVIYSRTLGGRDRDVANAICLDDFDNVYVAGGTDSNNFTKGKAAPFQGRLKGESEAFLVKIGRLSRQSGLTITPRHLRFESRDGDQPIKRTTLRNTGRVDVGYRIVKVVGPFFNVSGFEDGVLEPGQSVDIKIQFRPVRGERSRGALFISTTLPGAKSCVKVTLFGRAKNTIGGGGSP